MFSPLLPSWKGGHCCTSIILSYWCTDRLLIVGVHLIETHSTFAIQVYCAKTKSTKKHFYTFLLCLWCRAFIAHTHNTRTVSGEKRWRKNGRKMKRKKERDGKQSRFTNFSGQEQQMPMSFFIFSSIYPYISKRLWNEMHDTNCMKWHLYSLAKKHSTIFINQFVCRLKYIILSFLSLTLPCTIRREQQQHPNKNEAGGRNWVRRTHK